MSLDNRAATFRIVVTSVVVTVAASSIGQAQERQRFRLPPGFELSEFSGSDLANDITCMTLDPKGRVVVAGRGFIRLLMDDDGNGRADRAIDITRDVKDAAHGLLCESDTLWAMVDGGLWRFRIDASGTKQVGRKELVRKLRTGGEHTAHAIRRGPDGWLYLLCGDQTGIDSTFVSSPTSPITEPNGGCMVRLSPDFSKSEVVAHGFRNPYAFDFNLDGAWFTYDSDNERCVSLPWFEPTRVYHVVAGGHHGWLAPQRASTWRMPPYFPDVVAPVATLGRGSPTGVVCYRHSQFPVKYHGGLFVADWTFGRIEFVKLERSASGYRSVTEPFLQSVGEDGFAPTALAVDASSGDLYVSIGGRGTRGAVYRVRYPSRLPDAKPLIVHPISISWTKEYPNDLTRDQVTSLKRVRQIQAAIGDFGAKQALGTVWEGYSPRAAIAPDQFARERVELRQLFPAGHAILDREVSRTLAMLEDDDKELKSRVASRWSAQSDPIEDIHYLIVMARLRGERTSEVTRATAKALLALDAKIAERRLFRDRNWPLRIAETHAALARHDPRLNRIMLDDAGFGSPDHALFCRCPGWDRRRAAESFLARSQMDANFPWNAELVGLLAELPVDRSLPILRGLWSRGGLEETILPYLARHAAFEDREKFIAGLRSPRLETVRVCVEAIERLGGKGSVVEQAALIRAMGLLGDGRTETALRDRLAKLLTAWTGHAAFGADSRRWAAWLEKAHPKEAAITGEGIDNVAWAKRLASIDWSAGSAVRGRQLFTTGSCSVCHSGQQALGPDLRGVTKRFSREDLFSAILQPSKDISPRYRTTQVETIDGKSYQGLIVYEAVDGMILQSGPTETIRIDGRRIESKRVTDRSLMPSGLIDKWSDRDIADLYAYLKELGSSAAP
jgi:putative heme-binding domain-containing protein